MVTINQEKNVKRIEEGLTSYEKAILDTEEHYDELERYGRYQPEAPYRYKHLIPHWISLIEEGDRSKEFQEKYHELTELLYDFERKKGKDLHEKLLFDLKRDVEHYPTLVCYFGYLEPYDLEYTQDLSIRSSMEILFIELEKNFDLADMKSKVAILDEVLKCIYTREIDTIVKYCADAENLAYPDRFWWEHPVQFLQNMKKP